MIYSKPLKVLCVSDTHGWDMPIERMPEADIMIHAGDSTFRGTVTELREFYEYLVPHKKRYKEIIIIPGNHDFGWESDPDMYRQIFKGITVLINETIIHTDKYGQDWKIWGSPVCPPFGRWAFYQKDNVRKFLWDKIPDDTDIVITHGPPKTILDEVEEYYAGRHRAEHVGCPHLYNRILKLQPHLHVFGHVHEGYGQSCILKTECINPSIMNRRYQPLNEPILVEIGKE